MSSKRSLKKLVRYMCGDMAAECIIAKTVIPGVDATVMGNIVVKIAALQDATLRMISFSYDKVMADFDTPAAYRAAKSAYMRTAFRSLKGEFNKKVDEIVKDMNAALPESQKELNKKH